MATQVDFYLISGQEETARQAFACQLIEKAYLRKHRVYVHCADKTTTHQMDEFLWTFRDDSFIPHNIAGEGPTPPPPIQLGYQEIPERQRDLLINLSPGIPDFFGSFKRVFEIVPEEDTAKDKAREHYKIYREKQCQLFSHDLTKTTA